MATANFWPTQLNYQSRPTANLFNFCVFHPILIKFSLGANIVQRTIWHEFEIATAIFFSSLSYFCSCSYFSEGRLKLQVTCGLRPPQIWGSLQLTAASNLRLPAAKGCRLPKNLGFLWTKAASNLRLSAAKGRLNRDVTCGQRPPITWVF